MGLILAKRKDGVEVGTEKAWEELQIRNDKAVFYQQIDEENSTFFKVFDQLQNKFGNHVIAFELPTSKWAFPGIVNVAR